jgi:CO/xanthine dehydrogenase Mo-binding subunit
VEASELTDWPAGSRFSTVGSALQRTEAAQKTSGSARYTADVRLPGQLTARVLRSPHPHARIRAVDTTGARRVPGVVAVLTGADADGITWYEEGVPLFSDVVRFVGDEIAAVAATSEQAARDGVAAIEVDYELLPHVVELEDALAAGAPAVHGGSNVAGEPKEQARGDAEAALRRAPVIVEGTYRTPTAIHNSLEPHGCVASWEGDRLTLYVSTQGVNDVRTMTADALGLDHGRVRVVAEHVGGGFGAKQVPWKDVVIAALLSRRTGSPVQLMLDRRAENLAAGKRGATVQRVRLGADESGRLLAVDAELLLDRGAYRTGGEAAAVWGPYLHLYRCEDVRTHTTSVYTNTGPAVAFRAPGYVEAAFALESAMDELAERVGLDPIELRRRNYSERDQQQDLPWSSPEALRTAYRRVAEVAGWDDRTSREAPPPDDGEVRHGRGFAAHEWMAGSASPPGFAGVELHDDGSVEVVTAMQDIGTGTRTMMAQVAAEELAVDPERVTVRLGDTAAGPPAPTSSGSASAPTMAPAVRAAAADARRQLLDAAAAQLDCDASDLSVDHGKIVHGDGRTTTVSEVLEQLGPRGVHGRGGTTETPTDVSVRTFGAAVADVAVDVATGEVRVTRVVVAPDCGRILNPLLVRSQVSGGVTQGIGFALTESQLLDADLGVVVNDTLEEYLVPTVADTCTIEHAEVDLPDLAANPLGVKGIGELPLIPVAPAIANAVYDAIGIRLRELPLTRRRVLDALEQIRPPEGAR